MPIIHQEPHPFAGRIVGIKKTAKHFQVEDFAGAEFHLEDWWDRVNGNPWKESNGNIAACVYAMRVGMSHKDGFPPNDKGGVPIDNEVVYGKINGFVHLVHVNEIDWPVDFKPAA